MKPFYVITIHPSFVEEYRRFGVVRSAERQNLADVTAVDLRQFAIDKHGTVDGYPYGGGDGMVLRPEPLAKAVEHGPRKGRVILTTPAGRLWSNEEARRFAASDEPVTIVCGRFAGVDQRFVDAYVTDEISLGDYVLSGGELAGLAVVDSILRFVPGVLGHEESAGRDSFGESLEGGLEEPLYTRPAEFQGRRVPEELLSGHHERIQAWRRRQARRRTRERRPDLARDEDGE